MTEDEFLPAESSLYLHRYDRACQFVHTALRQDGAYALSQNTDCQYAIMWTAAIHLVSPLL